MSVPASDSRDSTWCAECVSREVVGQLHPLFAQTIHVGGFQAFVPKTTHISKPHVIHNDVQYIGPFLVLASDILVSMSWIVC